MLEFSDEVVIGKVNIQVDITENDIENVVVGAIEGGCRYWMGIDNTKPEFKDKPKDEPLSTWCARLLLDGKTVELYDIEDKKEKFELTLVKLLEGLQQNATERPKHNDKENWDADDADCIFQYALFKEIVYC